MPKILFWIFVVVWFWAAYEPLYRFDWFLENVVVFLFVPFAVFSYYKLRLSSYFYVLIFIFGVMHVLASHYTYQATPWGDWLSLFTGGDRNQFDRVTHFVYGLLAVQILNELLSPYVSRGIFKHLVIFSAVFSVGSLYEIVEFLVGVSVAPGKGLGFLGFQGDIWDTQKDIGLQAVGAVLGLTIISFKEQWEQKRKFLAGY